MTKKLLLIDDDPGIGHFVRKVAEDLGYEVHTQTEAAGFLRCFDQHRPDVIMLDLTMPETDGVELLQALAQRQCRSGIFIFSGYDARICQMAFQIGQIANLDMREIIPKPVRAAKLRNILSAV
ncbi:response regulator [Minwuia thermotolerans]|uniref:Response regulatory domain-containing protein n=1 Tax=Minwuia thermotolerans TaxID=2056226 RepID=A0A2M9G1Y5_9PROT|nr:response regulator [Minwuia thermotolerans]PJK29729.1 hypothetical protein CVT23_11870 [Minwuia thermotolerans]